MSFVTRLLLSIAVLGQIGCAYSSKVAKPFALPGDAAPQVACEMSEAARIVEDPFLGSAGACRRLDVTPLACFPTQCF